MHERPHTTTPRTPRSSIFHCWRRWNINGTQHVVKHGPSRSHSSSQKANQSQNKDSYSSQPSKQACGIRIFGMHHVESSHTTGQYSLRDSMTVPCTQCTVHIHTNTQVLLGTTWIGKQSPNETIWKCIGWTLQNVTVRYASVPSTLAPPSPPDNPPPVSSFHRYHRQPYPFSRHGTRFVGWERRRNKKARDV